MAGTERHLAGDDVVCVYPHDGIAPDTIWHIIHIEHGGQEALFHLHRWPMPRPEGSRGQPIQARVPKSVLDRCFVTSRELDEMRRRRDRISKLID